MERLIPGWSVQTAVYLLDGVAAVYVTVCVVLPGKFKNELCSAWLTKLGRNRSRFVATKRTRSPGLLLTCAEANGRLATVI
jgi:hypothetical protein